VAYKTYAPVGNFLVEYLTDPLVFLGTYFCVKFAQEAYRFERIENWPHVSEVDRDSDEFKEQLDYFTASCNLRWKHKYNYRLKLHKLWRVDRPDDDDDDGRPMTPSDRGRHLFHGTGTESAQGIVRDGFRLPKTGGMFGKGIYFADCPMKCWSYCCKQLRFGGRGLVFLCRVDLGTQCRKKWGDSSLDAVVLAEKRKTWWGWAQGYTKKYDSVVGLTEEEGGSLRVPEYIVYRTDRIKICYLCEVAHVGKGKL